MIKGKTIVLGVTGGIAVYKVADLASRLTQLGAKVEVVMTESAMELISPLTFQTLTGRRVHTDLFDTPPDWHVTHVALGEMADVVVIAPATANTIAKICHGVADNLLTCTVLATRSPVIIAPAMNNNMWENPVTQENVARLKARGFVFAGPGYGRLATGKIGVGRLVENGVIIGTVAQVLGRSGDLAGKTVVVTAGGTQEPIDPVRIITNRSSGKQGYALAEAARDRGAKVVLVTAPVAIPEPVGVEVVKVETAREMKKALDKVMKNAHALIMTAAVADYEAKSPAKNKIKKEASGSLVLELTRTPDIITEVKGDFIRIGFAAESQDLIENARKKLIGKKLDLIVANDITRTDSGFGADTNKVYIISPGGKLEDLPLMSKREVADRVLDRVVKLLKGKS
ncbi:MAG: bifunctional phosphopantothenoylcysteine decarboxylase/phosphopantothenate--cysteine ligase CoaBC [Chloroflexota bacterium]